MKTFAFIFGAGYGNTNYNDIDRFDVIDDTLNFTKNYLKGFSGATGDSIINALPNGYITTAQFVKGAGTETASTASQFFIFDTGDGEIRFDGDGSGGSESPTLVAQMTNVNGTFDFSDIAVTF